MADVIALIGAGSIGQAVARRVSGGKHLLLADLRQENADAAAKTLDDAGFTVSTATVDVSSRKSVQALVGTATALGDVVGVIHAAGGLAQPSVTRDDPQGRSLRHCASLAAAVAEEAAIDAILAHIGWAHVPAERGAIHLDLAGERGVAGLRRHGLTQLVHQHERSLVLDVEIARELNRR